MEFLLLVKGSRNRGLFSIFFKLNAGLDVYFGNEKVFNFEQHGFNDEVEPLPIKPLGFDFYTLSELAQVQTYNEQN